MNHLKRFTFLDLLFFFRIESQFTSEGSYAAAAVVVFVSNKTFVTNQIHRLIPPITIFCHPVQPIGIHHSQPITVHLATQPITGHQAAQPDITVFPNQTCTARCHLGEKWSPNPSQPIVVFHRRWIFGGKCWEG